MAPERHGPRARRLQVFARLGGWRRGLRPKHRDYSKKISKATKRLALRKALSERIKSGDVLVIDSFAVSEPKTKQFLKLIQEITPEPKTLVIAAAFDENTYRAARNVQPALLDERLGCER